jgi:hypothetical protein
MKIERIESLLARLAGELTKVMTAAENAWAAAQELGERVGGDDCPKALEGLGTIGDIVDVALAYVRQIEDGTTR